MDMEAYFKSRSQELAALSKRVRQFIGHAHQPTHGHWAEAVLRSALRDSLPATVCVGSGFIVTADSCSKQIDVLIYDATSPVFFRDGDLAIVPPDFVRAVIEVKSNLTHEDVRDGIDLLVECRQVIPEDAQSRVITGLFGFAAEGLAENFIGRVLRDNCAAPERLVNIVTAGQTRFVRYWETPPQDEPPGNQRWSTYDLPEMAFGYFTHNILTHLTPEYHGWRGNDWFPPQGKGHGFLGATPTRWAPE